MSNADDTKTTEEATAPRRQAPIIEAPPRTECACATCTQCCKDQPGSLAPGDFEAIREHLQLTDDAIRAAFRSSEGALVQLQVDGRTVIRRQRTIVPLYVRREKRCIFLDHQDRCKVHAVKPAGCAMFDTHMDKGAADARSYWLLMQQSDEGYQALRRTLKISEHYKPKAY